MMEGKIKSIVKKITSVAAVASLAVSAGSVTAFADEVQTFDIAEDDYYVCDGLDITSEQVSNIIDKVNDMYSSGEITAEIAEDMVNTFSASANANEASVPAKDFFLAVPVASGVTLTETNTITFKIKVKSSDYKVLLVDQNNKLSIGNAVPTLTKDNFKTPVYSKPDKNNGEIATYTTNVINPVTTTNNGILCSLRIKLEDNSNHFIGNSLAYNILRNNNFTNVTVTGVGLQDTGDRKNIGSLGDINGDGWVNGNDKQKLIAYMLHEEDGNLSPMEYAAADVTENGIVDVRDYSVLTNYVSGVYTDLRSANS